MSDIFYYDAHSDEYILEGCLNLDKIGILLAKWEEIRSSEPKTLTVNCAGVYKADSSFFAFLVEMRRWAHHHNQRWQLKKLPVFLKGFLSVYGIEDFLKSDWAPKL